MERDRVTVQEAAHRLGISESGVRKRVKRDQLVSEKDTDGRLYVYLDTTGPEADTVPESVPDKYVARLEDENEWLREQVRRQQEIIVQQSISIRALSAPESPDEPVQEEEPPTEAGGPENQSSRPWWRFWG